MAESWCEERLWQEDSAMKTMVLSFLKRFPSLPVPKDFCNPRPEDLEVHRCVTSFTNCVIRIRIKQLRHLGFIVKMASSSRQQNLIEDLLLLPEERGLTEHNASVFFNSIVPGCSPTSLFYDHSNRILCTQELTGHLPLSGAVLRGQFSEQGARALGTTLASIHSGTLLTTAGCPDVEELIQQFPTREAMLALIRTYHFERPFDPKNTERRCHHTVLRMLPEILEDAAIMAAQMEARESFTNDLECLIHGDLHIESVLVGGGCDIKLVDTEFTRVGPCAFDMGLLLATLLGVFHRYKHLLHGAARVCSLCTVLHHQYTPGDDQDSRPPDNNSLVHQDDGKDYGDNNHKNVSLESVSTVMPTIAGEQLRKKELGQASDKLDLEQASMNLEHILEEAGNPSGGECEHTSDDPRHTSEEPEKTADMQKRASAERIHFSENQAQASEKADQLSGSSSEERFISCKSCSKVSSSSGDNETQQVEDQQWCSDSSPCIDQFGISKTSGNKFNEKHEKTQEQCPDLQSPQQNHKQCHVHEASTRACSEELCFKDESHVSSHESCDNNSSRLSGYERRDGIVEGVVDRRMGNSRRSDDAVMACPHRPTDAVKASGESHQIPADDIILKCMILLEAYTNTMCAGPGQPSEVEDADVFKRKLLQKIATFTGCELLAWVVGPPHMDFMDSCPAAQVDCVLTARRLLTNRHRIDTVHDFVRLLS